MEVMAEYTMEMKEMVVWGYSAKLLRTEAISSIVSSFSDIISLMLVAMRIHKLLCF
jgi:hypothetical protein